MVGLGKRSQGLARDRGGAIGTLGGGSTAGGESPPGVSPARAAVRQAAGGSKPAAWGSGGAFGEAIGAMAEGRWLRWGRGRWREMGGRGGATSYPDALRGTSTGTRCQNTNFDVSDEAEKQITIRGVALCVTS